MSIIEDLESKTRAVNERIGCHGSYLCWGGDFTTNGNVFYRGASHLLSGKPIIFPICNNNGYYHEAQIESLARGVSEFGNPVYVFFTNGPAVHNIKAMVDFKKSATDVTKSARVKANLERNSLRNRLARGLHSIGTNANTKFSYFDWEDIYQHPFWAAENTKLRALYKADKGFHDIVEKTTREVLSHRIAHYHNLGINMKHVTREGIDPQKIHTGIIAPNEIAEDVVELSKDYTLDELGALAVANKFIGSQGVCYVYKEGWPAFENLADGQFDHPFVPAAGFLTLHSFPGTYHSETRVMFTAQQLEALSSTTVPKVRRPNAPMASLRKTTLQSIT